MKDNRGVTLVEMLTALAILAILSAAGGVGLLRGMPERRMMSAARDLYCDLRKAQSRAIAAGETVTVNFSLEKNILSLVDAGGQTVSETRLPGFIDLCEIKGDRDDDRRFYFNSRGIKTGVSGSVWIRYHKPGYDWRQVLVRSSGSMAIRRSSDSGKTWEY